ncbi:MAG TPA: mechanosensitive ion channel [Pseudomonas xinjiangensis]|uniref:Mechanosensitive ion channel n=2 Tax=root TaxID=1 RepID=A0A7V1FRN2_9GAMM|nr:mechanosensitive ion channel [Halopseudomonas xinjiangensis]HEC46904.1 mechanosensitive ion channel [Halopseudomonas xinjiangensis]
MLDVWTTYIPIPELRALLAAAIAVLIMSFVARALTRLMIRLTGSFTFFRELARNIKKPVHVLLPLMAMQTIWTAAPDDLLMIGGLRHVTALAIIGVFTWLGLRAVDAIQQAILLQNPVNISNNLRARRIQTQTRVLTRTLSVLVLIIGVAGMLMTFPAARQFGASLLASAGLAGLAVGFAARPVLGNMIAGLQIAITQPIRLDDVVIVEGEWGRIEEITGTYVVVRVWDNRRLVVPLQWFIENPFQNWTRHTSSLLGSVFFWVDYSVPMVPLRQELERLCQSVPELWDGEVCILQVTDCNERAMQVRVLASSGDSSLSWDLRCYLREHLLCYINDNYPGALPKLRALVADEDFANPDAPPVERETSEAERQPPV